MDWGAYLAEVQHDLQVKHLVRIIRSKCENLSPVFRKILIFELMSPAVDSSVSAFPGCTSSNTPEAVCKYSAVHFFGQNAKYFLYEQGGTSTLYVWSLFPLLASIQRVHSLDACWLESAFNYLSLKWSPVKIQRSLWCHAEDFQLYRSAPRMKSSTG